MKYKIWISVTEKLPQNREDCIVLTVEGVVTLGWWSPVAESWRVIKGNREVEADVTYWMPLPAPPKNDKE